VLRELVRREWAGLVLCTLAAAESPGGAQIRPKSATLVVVR